MAHSLARLTRSGVLSARNGILQPTDQFLAHLSLFRHSGRVHQWDLRGLVEQALTTWDGDAARDLHGDPREDARHLVGFLPSATGPAFPVLDAFVAAGAA